MSRKCLWRLRLFRAVLVVLVAFVLGHNAAWLWSVHRLSGLIEQEAGELRLRGWKVAAGPMRRGGWPGRVRVELGPSSIANGGLELRADALVAESALFRTGPLILWFGGSSLHFGANSRTLQVVGDLSAEALGDRLVLTGAHARIGDGFEAATLRVEVGPTYMDLAASDVVPIDAAAKPMRSTAGLEVRAETTGALPFPGNVRSAVAWRDTGGSLDFSLTRLTTAGFSAMGRIGLRLDDGLQPSGEGRLHVAGYKAGLDWLRAAGWVSVSAATAATSVLGLVSAPLPNGEADIPVRIDKSIFYAAGFALIRLPALDWAQPGPLP